MRVLIVDDEPLSRESLARIVAARGDVEHVATAGDAVSALEKLRDEQFHLLLLDIAMPEMSGLELVDRLRERPQKPPAIVFVTAHDRHAVKAFEKRAVDFVLKPFSAERVHLAIDTAAQRTEAERAALLLQGLPEKPAPPRLAIKSNGRILLINPAEVVSVEAEGNYVLLLRGSGSHILREPISVVAEKLKPYGFVRIHRSVLVNSAYVEELHPLASGDYGLKLTNGKTYTISRNYKKNLKQFASFWMGTDAFSDD